MTLKELMASHLDPVFYDTTAFAHLVGYRQPLSYEGEPLEYEGVRLCRDSEIPAIINPHDPEIIADILETDRAVRIQANDSRGIANAQSGDRMQIDGLEVIIAEAMLLDGAREWKLILDSGKAILAG